MRLTASIGIRTVSTVGRFSLLGLGRIDNKVGHLCATEYHYLPFYLTKGPRHVHAIGTLSPFPADANGAARGAYRVTKKIDRLICHEYLISTEGISRSIFSIGEDGKCSSFLHREVTGPVSGIDQAD